jgi:hypothetical protein
LPSSSSVEPEPSILDCPPEDIAEYPTHEPPPVGWEDTILEGGCVSDIKVSKEELIFDAQGGVRCVTAEASFRIIIGNNSGATESERACVGENGVDRYYYTKLKCPWFTATKVDDRILHISVNQNETGEKRDMNVNIIHMYCLGSALITQSAD